MIKYSKNQSIFLLRLLSFIICVITSSTILQAQLSTIHYLPPLYAAADEIIGDHFIFVTNPTAQETTVRFRDGDGNMIQSGNDNDIQDSVVPGNTTKKIWLGNDRRSQGVLRRDQLNQVITNDENIIVTADDPVYVQVRHIDDIHGLLYSSKGDWAPGLRFRAGTAFSKNGRVTFIFNIVGENRTDFISVMALNDNTKVEFKEFKPGVDILDDGPAQDFSIDLNQNNSYTLASVPGANDNMFLTGTLIISNEPIVVNCGSWQIDNSDLFGVGQGDIGVDQIIPMNRLDTEYIVMNVDGSDDAEKIMVVADVDGTQYFINGSNNAEGTLAAGEFAIIDRDRFSVNNNMYIRTNVPAVVYQTTGLEDFSSGFSIITPLKCWGTQRAVIPRIDDDFDLDLSRINVVAQKNTNINVAGGSLSNPLPVPGNPDYETYKITPEITSDIYITSNKNIQIGTSLRKLSKGAATYYSEYFQSDTMLIEELCAGETYGVGNSIYGETGIYYDTLKNINQCDSIITLDLMVFPRDTTEIDRFICPSDSVLFEGQYYSEEGTYFATVNSINNCDSTLSLNVFLYNAPSEEENTTVCEGEFYNGFQLYKDTSFVEVLSSAQGCDSTLITNVQVFPIYEFIVEDTLCFGESISIDGAVVSTSGQYIEGFSTIDGCDSIYIIELEVLDEDLQNFDPNVCEGEEYLGSIITADTTITVLSQNEQGCQATSIYNIIVNDIIEESASFNVCPGQVVNGVIISNDTIFVDEYQTILGCDSLVTNIVTIENFESLDTVYINPGETYNGINIENDSLLSILLQSENGCDSLANTQVIINPVLTESLDFDLCPGELYDGISYARDTVLVFNYTASNGFDSLVTVTLNIQESYNQELIERLCFGDSILFEGNYYDETGSYTNALVSTFGCDSLIILQLTVDDQIESSGTHSICEGESVFLEGGDQTIAGTYIDVYGSVDGCDSIVTTILMVNDTFNSLDTLYVMEDEGYDDDILLTENLSTINGCDSIINTQIIVLNSSSSSIDETICEGELYSGFLISNDTLIIDTLTASNGADSFVFIQVNVLPNFTNNLMIDLCEGDEYEGMIITEDLFLEEIFTASNGCDSLVNINITANSTYANDETIFLNEGETYNGIPIDVDTVIVENYVTVSGCDSVVNINIILLLDVFTSSTIDLCEGELFNGELIQADTSIIDTLTSSIGTDSIHVTSINFLDTTWTMVTTQACDGQIIEYNGILISEDASITELILNDEGCYDVLVNAWDFEENIIQDISEEICFGQSFDFDGQTLNLPGLYSDTLMSSFGCDSIVNLALSIFEMQENEVIIEESYCQDESITLDMMNYGNFNAFEWEDASTASTIDVSEAGTYYVTVTDLDACIEIYVFDVPEPNIIAIDLSVILPDCLGNGTGGLEIITPLGTSNTYEYSLDATNFSSNTNFNQLVPGTYTLSVIDDAGCSIEEVFEIDESSNLDLIIEGEEIIPLGDSTVLMVQSNNFNIDQIIWEPADNLSCSNCLNPTASPNASTEYTVTVSTLDGCVDSTSFILRIDTNVKYYAPNTFSPNADGINDYFTIFANSSVEQISHLAVYDRWGNQVFFKEGLAPNDEIQGWDGKLRGESVNPGIYVYSAQLLLANGEVVLIKGDLTLIK